MKRIILIISMISATVSCLSARTIRSIFLQAPRNAPEFALLYPSKSSPNKEASPSIKVSLPGRNLSADLEIPAGDLTLAILSTPPLEGEEIPAGAQRIKIPASWTNCTIIFVPDRKNEVFPGRAFVVNSTNENFPRGDTLVYNLSNTLFSGDFGSKKINLKPRRSGVFGAPLNEQGAYPVVLSCLLPDAKKKQVFSRTKWVHNPNARQILFVTPSAGEKTPRVWSVIDHRE